MPWLIESYFEEEMKTSDDFKKKKSDEKAKNREDAEKALSRYSRIHHRDFDNAWRYSSGVTKDLDDGERAEKAVRDHENKTGKVGTFSGKYLDAVNSVRRHNRELEKQGKKQIGECTDMDAWLVEAYLDEEYENFDFLEVTQEGADLLLEYVDPERKEIVNDACKVVRKFMRDNGIRIEASKFFINRDFKKGNSNEIKITFSHDALSTVAIGLLFGVIVEVIYNYVVSAQDMDKIDSLLKDKKKKDELNKRLKEEVNGKVTVKNFSPSKSCITLEYKK